MNLSVIIVSWNVREKLQENLQALFESVRVSGCTAEVFVVDNASVDKTVEMVESEFPSVKIIKNKENLGFAKANNQAIKRSRGDYVKVGGNKKFAGYCGRGVKQFYLYSGSGQGG